MAQQIVHRNRKVCNRNASITYKRIKELTGRKVNQPTGNLYKINVRTINNRKIKILQSCREYVKVHYYELWEKSTLENTELPDILKMKYGQHLQKTNRKKAAGSYGTTRKMLSPLDNFHIHKITTVIYNVGDIPEFLSKSSFIILLKSSGEN